MFSSPNAGGGCFRSGFRYPAVDGSVSFSESWSATNFWDIDQRRYVLQANHGGSGVHHPGRQYTSISGTAISELLLRHQPQIRLSAVSDTVQSGTVGGVMPQFLSVRTTDPAGNAVNNIPVSFKMTSQPAGAQGSSLSTVSVQTERSVVTQNGIASVPVKVGNRPGLYEVTASCTTCSPSSQVFSITALSPILTLSLTNAVIPPSSRTSRSVISVDARVTTHVGQPMSGKQVSFASTTLDLREAGHHHGPVENAPVGVFEDFFGTDARSCLTGSDGTCSVYYFAAEHSGRVEIEGTVDGSRDTKQLMVKVVGLARFTSTAAVPTGITPAHLSTQWATVELNRRLLAIADAYWQTTLKVLYINDMSLPWGGVFDICLTGIEAASCSVASPWKAPHHYHRWGRSVDISRNPPDTSPPVGGRMTVEDERLLHHLMTTSGLFKVPEGPIHYELAPLIR